VKSLIAIGCVPLMLSAVVAQAEDSCTNRSLRGTYAVWGGSESTPAVFVGLAHFDGRGSLTSTTTQNDKGRIQANDSSSGTYNVDADCRVTATSTNDQNSLDVSHLIGAVAESGRRLLFISSDLHHAESAQAIRLEQTRCEQLPPGEYLAEGRTLWFTDGNGGGHAISLPSVAEGRMDATSNLTFNSDANAGFFIVSGSLTSHAEVHPDCSFDTYGSNGGHAFGVMILNSRRVELHQVSVDPGFTVTFTVFGTPSDDKDEGRD
jgi:hypothetical protein